MIDFKILAVLAALFATPVANASRPIDPVAFMLLNPTPSAGGTPFDLSGANGQLTITYSGVPDAANIWFSNNVNGNNLNQSPATLEPEIEGLMGSGINFAEQNDNAGGGNSASFTNTAIYSVLAVHFGKHELVFDFGQQIAIGSIFTITTSGQAAGLSNFRAYLDPLAQDNLTGVPLPGALWLFGTSLIGLVSLNRKKI